MKYGKVNLKFLFKHIKNGDFLIFYSNLIGSKFISFVTGGKLDHIGGIFDVHRDKNIVSFSFGEQRSKEGKTVKRYSITKCKDGTYIIDARFRNEKIKFYYLPNVFKITPKQNTKLREYWNTRDDYSFLQLPLTLNWIYKIFNIFLSNKKITLDRFCSGACKRSMDIIGIYPTKSNDNAPSPIEFVRFSYIKNINKVIIPKIKKLKKSRYKIFCRDLIITIFTFTVVTSIVYRIRHAPHFYKADKEIFTQIYNSVNVCQNGYFISWLHFNTTSPMQYQFIDVVGYSKTGKGAYSVKDSKVNHIYNREDLSINNDLYAYLLNIGSLNGVYLTTDQLEQLSSQNSDINFLLKNVNRDIKSVAFSIVTKYPKLAKAQLINRITDVFMITQTSNDNTCDRKQMIKIVENLANNNFELLND